MNRSLDDLATAFAGARSTVYSYIVQTVREDDGRFVQRGTAPNFYGDRVTLCTCKHHMRTFRDCDAWIGTWVAGFTGVTTGARQNDLVYLMKVGHAFPSHAALWASDNIPAKTKDAKAAHLSRMGDLFRPKDAVDDPFDANSYLPPVDSHSHRLRDAWHNDINYSRNKRPAALLVGDPRNTSIWNRPLIRCQHQLHRGQKKWTLADLISQLRD